MTRMSRSRRVSEGPCGDRPVCNGILRPWHTLCFASGCFYVLPIPDVGVNEPPVVVEPDEDPKVVLANGTEVVLTIIAYDPEGSTIDFEWPDLDNVPYEEDVYSRGELRVARVRILDVDALPSPRVRAFVFDGDRDNTVTVRFAVELP